MTYQLNIVVITIEKKQYNLHTTINCGFNWPSVLSCSTLVSPGLPTAIFCDWWNKLLQAECTFCCRMLSVKSLTKIITYIQINENLHGWHTFCSCYLLHQKCDKNFCTSLPILQHSPLLICNKCASIIKKFYQNLQLLTEFREIRFYPHLCHVAKEN